MNEPAWLPEAIGGLVVAAVTALGALALKYWRDWRGWLSGAAFLGLLSFVLVTAAQYYGRSFVLQHYGPGWLTAAFAALDWKAVGLGFLLGILIARRVGRAGGSALRSRGPDHQALWRMLTPDERGILVEMWHREDRRLGDWDARGRIAPAEWNTITRT